MRVPDATTIRAAVDLAGRAPSIHNSQPWHWDMRDVTLQLGLDRSRGLPATDPLGHDLLLSCGAAIHHAHVAFAALGWDARPTLLDDAGVPDRLASFEFEPRSGTAVERLLAQAIVRRRSDRRSYSTTPIPTELVRTLATAAAEQGAVAHWLSPDEQLVALAIAGSADAAAQPPGYQLEQQLWAGALAPSDVGIPVANLPAGRSPGDRTFPAGELPTDDRPGHPGRLLMIGTPGELRSDRLRAGMALSAVLLRATAAGLACCPLSQPAEHARFQGMLAAAFAGVSAVPHILVRLGYPIADEPELPATPRIRTSQVLTFAADYDRSHSGSLARR